MSSKPVNSYVPMYVPKNLPWYECDDLITWYGQGKCTDFQRGTGKRFREAKIINFDKIHRLCRGEMVPPDLLKQCQTIIEKTASGYSSSEQVEIRSSAFRTDRKDIFFKKETIKKHFKNIDNKKTKVLLRQSSF